MMSRSRCLRNPIAFVSALVLACCFIILTLTMLRLPDLTTNTTTHRSYNKKSPIGKFGEMMIDMLPEDLAFTVFLPSEKAFERDLKLNISDSFLGEKMNDTYAVVSRVLGFSAVPRILTSDKVPFGNKEITYDSISGFVLYIWKDEDGMLVVNGVLSERVDLRKKGTVVHVMDGVLMDAEFQQSVQYDDNEKD